jgi:Flp pilus assembly protein protease CpaA
LQRSCSVPSSSTCVRRIPNALVLAGIAVALAAHAVSMAFGRPPLAGPAWWAPLAGMAAGFRDAAPPLPAARHRRGRRQADGDGGAFIGAPPVLTATLYTLLAGGVLS